MAPRAGYQRLLSDRRFRWTGDHPYCKTYCKDFTECARIGPERTGCAKLSPRKPARDAAVGGFQDRCHQPLGHLSGYYSFTTVRMSSRGDRPHGQAGVTNGQSPPVCFAKLETSRVGGS
jgi:hypothetical protein